MEKAPLKVTITVEGDHSNEIMVAVLAALSGVKASGVLPAAPVKQLAAVAAGTAQNNEDTTASSSAPEETKPAGKYTFEEVRAKAVQLNKTKGRDAIEALVKGITDGKFDKITKIQNQPELFDLAMEKLLALEAGS